MTLLVVGPCSLGCFAPHWLEARSMPEFGVERRDWDVSFSDAGLRDSIHPDIPSPLQEGNTVAAMIAFVALALWVMIYLAGFF